MRQLVPPLCYRQVVVVGQVLPDQHDACQTDPHHPECEYGVKMLQFEDHGIVTAAAPPPVDHFHTRFYEGGVHDAIPISLESKLMRTPDQRVQEAQVGRSVGNDVNGVEGD